MQNSQLSVKSEATDGDIQKKKKKEGISAVLHAYFKKKLLKWMKPFIADQGNYLFKKTHLIVHLNEIFVQKG